MKIAIEAQRIFRKNKHGMDFVILELIIELQKLDLTNEYFILVGPGEDRCFQESSNFHLIELKSSFYPLWEQYLLPRAIKKIKPDFLHCTSNTAPLSCSVPLIITLHDIIFMEKQQGKNTSLYQQMGWYYRGLIVPKVIKKCAMVITVSNYEASRIKAATKLPKERIKVLYNSANKKFKPFGKKREDISISYIKEKTFFFFLGNTDPKKNTKNTLIAYSMYLKESTKKIHLLIADLQENVVDSYIKEAGIEFIKPFIHFAGYIPNNDLPSIYNKAFAFLYPSLRESFGIPVLEAMACGTPLITSNTSALPEIAGSGAILTDPHNPKDIAKKMIKLENDPDFYAKNVSYGIERAKSFSWESSAHRLISLYESI